MKRMTKEEKSVQVLSRKQLHKFISKGDTIYTMVDHVSRSGMMRHIRTKVVRDGKIYDPTYFVAEVLDMRRVRDSNAIKVTGCGMDMGFHLIYNLSLVLFGDGYALKHRSL